jgi:hypothetical protein
VYLYPLRWGRYTTGSQISGFKLFISSTSDPLFPPIYFYSEMLSSTQLYCRLQDFGVEEQVTLL